jgi:hypothetical protein
MNFEDISKNVVKEWGSYNVIGLMKAAQQEKYFTEHSIRLYFEFWALPEIVQKN